MGNNPSSTAKSSEKVGSPASQRQQQHQHHLQSQQRQQQQQHQFGDKDRERDETRARYKPGAASGRRQDRQGQQDRQDRQEPRRRESLQALSSSAKAQAAPPSLTSTVAHPTSTSSSSTQARAISSAAPSPSSSPTPSPSQSQFPASAQPQPQALGGSQHTLARLQDTAPVSPRTIMGAGQSQPVASSPTPHSPHVDNLKSPPHPTEPALSPASRPVDVPLPAASILRSFQSSPPDSTTSFDAYHLPPSSFSRPPRLPLPIEEEVYTPGSPIISPTDLSAGDTEMDDIPRRLSVISSTVDDDEEPDNFEGYSTVAAGPKVPVVMEWRNAKPTDKVYVTGTFTNWERKFRLHKDGPIKEKDTLSATLQLPPGTHHVKFITNGDMMTSNHLPTTVDYTNILVNYIEVSLDQVPSEENPDSSDSAAATPTPTPSTPAPSRPLDIRPKPSSPAQQPIPQVTTPVAQDVSQPPPPQPPQPSQARPRSPSPKPSPDKSRTVPAAGTLVRLPRKHYTSQIPNYLLDLDTYVPSGKDHDTSPAAQAARHRIERANAAADSQPAPPSLPMFLSKSILNGTTPMKDDSSVLIMPNHTVLNHLATTNIKQGVLATSTTTRYKRKFLTTIMYKPRSDEGD